VLPTRIMGPHREGRRLGIGGPGLGAGRWDWEGSPLGKVTLVGS